MLGKHVAPYMFLPGYPSLKREMLRKSASDYKKCRKKGACGSDECTLYRLGDENEQGKDYLD